MSLDPDSEVQGILDEADAYFQRNDAEMTSTLAGDPLRSAIQQIHVSSPIRALLEIGALDGRRLSRVRDEFRCEVTGLEASPEAVRQGANRFPHVSLVQGVAPMGLNLWLGQKKFDVIVLGFFLYILPRQLLFQLASAVDQLLEDGGHIVLYDFISVNPRTIPYKHSPGLQTFKMDYACAWTWNPQYVLLNRLVIDHGGNGQLPLDQDSWVTIDTIRKLQPGEAYC